MKSTFLKQVTMKTHPARRHAIGFRPKFVGGRVSYSVKEEDVGRLMMLSAHTFQEQHGRAATGQQTNITDEKPQGESHADGREELRSKQ